MHSYANCWESIRNKDFLLFEGISSRLRQLTGSLLQISNHTHAGFPSLKTDANFTDFSPKLVLEPKKCQAFGSFPEVVNVQLKIKLLKNFVSIAGK